MRRQCTRSSVEPPPGGWDSGEKQTVGKKKKRENTMDVWDKEEVIEVDS